MSNFATRINKQSTISLSTNDNTVSLKLARGMDDGDLKKIQRRLADRVPTKNSFKNKLSFKNVIPLHCKK